MFMFYDFDDIRSLATIIDLQFRIDDHHHEKLIEEIIFDNLDSKDSLVNLMLYVVYAPVHELEEAVDYFLDLPLEQMPPYTAEPPEKPNKASCLCPPPEEGPYTWQTVLAKWRTQLQR